MVYHVIYKSLSLGGDFLFLLLYHWSIFEEMVNGLLQTLYEVMFCDMLI